MPLLPEFHLLRTPEHEPRAIPPKTFDKMLEAAGAVDEKLAESKPRQRMLAGETLPVKGPIHNPPGSDWWVAFLSVAYLAGLRWSEILGLWWSDLRFTGNPTIHI